MGDRPSRGAPRESVLQGSGITPFFGREGDVPLPLLAVVTLVPFAASGPGIGAVIAWEKSRGVNKNGLLIVGFTSWHAQAQPALYLPSDESDSEEDEAIRGADPAGEGTGKFAPTCGRSRRRVGERNPRKAVRPRSGFLRALHAEGGPDDISQYSNHKNVSFRWRELAPRLPHDHGWIDQAGEIHRAFQKDLCRLRLTAARAYVATITDAQRGASAIGGGTSLRLHARCQGLVSSITTRVLPTDASHLPSRSIRLIPFAAGGVRPHHHRIPLAFYIEDKNGVIALAASGCIPRPARPLRRIEAHEFP